MKRFVEVTNLNVKSTKFFVAVLSAKNNFFNTLMVFGDMQMAIIKKTFKMKLIKKFN